MGYSFYSKCSNSKHILVILNNSFCHCICNRPINMIWPRKLIEPILGLVKVDTMSLTLGECSGLVLLAFQGLCEQNGTSHLLCPLDIRELVGYGGLTTIKRKMGIEFSSHGEIATFNACCRATGLALLENNELVPHYSIFNQGMISYFEFRTIF